MAFWDRKRRETSAVESADGGRKSLFEALSSWDGRSPVAGLDVGEVPGAEDAEHLFHRRPPPAGEEPEEALLVPLRMACREASETNFAALYAAARGHRLASLWETLIERFRATKSLSREATHAVAARLRRRAADAEPVKLGLLLTAALQDRAALPDVEVLARHEELGFWSVLALTALSPRATDDVWAYAKGHRGWGRVHAVRRLATDAAQRPDIAAWLLREGGDTEVGMADLAPICATAGRLGEALAAPSVDDATLTGAARLLGGLFGARGAVPTFARWAGAPVAVRAFLRHAGGRPMTEAGREALRAIRATVSASDFLGGGPPEDPRARDAWLERRLALEDAGWDAAVAAELAQACDRLLTSS